MKGLTVYASPSDDGRALPAMNLPGGANLEER